MLKKIIIFFPPALQIHMTEIKVASSQLAQPCSSGPVSWLCQDLELGAAGGALVFTLLAQEL